MRNLALAVLVASIVGCVPPVPPAAPAPRQAMVVAAPLNRTWDATIDVFAERNIQIKTIDKASGLIVAEPQKTSDATIADCGKNMYGMAVLPTDATWNVLVRGDSATSTVKATVRFMSITTGTYGSSVECSSRGSWETSLEERIKVSAEAKKL